jgi:hypothetical protein
MTDQQRRLTEPAAQCVGRPAHHCKIAVLDGHRGGGRCGPEIDGEHGDATGGDPASLAPTAERGR